MNFLLSASYKLLEVYDQASDNVNDSKRQDNHVHSKNENGGILNTRSKHIH